MQINFKFIDGTPQIVVGDLNILYITVTTLLQLILKNQIKAIDMECKVDKVKGDYSNVKVKLLFKVEQKPNQQNTLNKDILELTNLQKNIKNDKKYIINELCKRKDDDPVKSYLIMCAMYVQDDESDISFKIDPQREELVELQLNFEIENSNKQYQLDENQQIFHKCVIQYDNGTNFNRNQQLDTIMNPNFLYKKHENNGQFILKVSNLDQDQVCASWVLNKDYLKKVEGVQQRTEKYDLAYRNSRFHYHNPNPGSMNLMKEQNSKTANIDDTFTSIDKSKNPQNNILNQENIGNANKMDETDYKLRDSLKNNLSQQKPKILTIMQTIVHNNLTLEYQDDPQQGSQQDNNSIKEDQQLYQDELNKERVNLEQMIQEIHQQSKQYISQRHQKMRMDPPKRRVWRKQDKRIDV